MADFNGCNRDLYLFSTHFHLSTFNMVSSEVTGEVEGTAMDEECLQMSVERSTTYNFRGE